VSSFLPSGPSIVSLSPLRTTLLAAKLEPADADNPLDSVSQPKGAVQRPPLSPAPQIPAQVPELRSASSVRLYRNTVRLPAEITVYLHRNPQNPMAKRERTVKKIPHRRCPTNDFTSRAPRCRSGPCRPVDSRRNRISYRAGSGLTPISHPASRNGDDGPGCRPHRLSIPPSSIDSAHAGSSTNSTRSILLTGRRSVASSTTRYDKG
jgi:hypothetical protein